ncbi:MAG: FAD:protein FMN transferase [Flavobacteriales bacterium]|jgi:thiamine biosynthesis lipoprotein|tara:strand:+ start:5901 stop:6890 length:990 start_codon:yes stop_codon:yes gene_type:complete
MKNSFLISIFFLSSFSFGQQVFNRTTKLMGSRFDITVVANDSIAGHYYINLAINEISRIEKLISSWDEESQTSKINRTSQVSPVTVDDELYALISRANKISRLTEGAFDISYASMDKVWHFDGSMKEMPTEYEIMKSVEKIGYQNIILNDDDNSVFFKLNDMKIGFGAIGKGYAADKAKSLLIKNGVVAGIINASGDLNAWGTQPNGKDWMVAIVNPLNKEKVFSWMPIKDKAVVTSGNYEKHVKFNDVLYSHIIDPRTGYPSTGVISVTVFTKTSELADALSTAIFVMGKDTGIDFVNQLHGVECIIIDKHNNLTTSNNIKLNPFNYE